MCMHHWDHRQKCAYCKAQGNSKSRYIQTQLQWAALNERLDKKFVWREGDGFRFDKAGLHSAGVGVPAQHG